MALLFSVDANNGCPCSLWMLEDRRLSISPEHSITLLIRILKELPCGHKEAEGRPDLDQMVPVFLVAHVLLAHLWAQQVSARVEEARNTYRSPQLALVSLL